MFIGIPPDRSFSLVELIVLNVGLQAGILSQLVFTMFVIMALVTTFLTTPIVSFLYMTYSLYIYVDIPLGINANSNSGVAAKLIGTAIQLQSRMTVSPTKILSNLINLSKNVCLSLVKWKTFHQ